MVESREDTGRKFGGYWYEIGRDTGRKFRRVTGRKLGGILGGSWEDTGRIKGGTF